jgi:hypothetical protein
VEAKPPESDIHGAANVFTNVFASATPADVTIDTVPRNVKMFKLFENELDSIASPRSIHWTFFGVTIGAALTLGVAISTGSIPPIKLGAFTATFWGSMLLTTYFLAMGILDYVKSRRVLKEIKKRPAA